MEDWMHGRLPWVLRVVGLVADCHALGLAC